ncbi:hypothetical protein [Bacillus haynesii]|uniref:hypothetical protein n=1 Tax=Bacillus haynesii TaxID=1925021 RepID=UPI00227F81AD|nr:hypothetical protein [Bacillus haynesii]MCY8754771.1 DUF1642 domain-containing protein [Bacillus haynesii]
MSEIKKPVITKEQAEALETLRRIGGPDNYILMAACDGILGGEFEDLDLMMLAAALINGYEVEKTPEEKVREYYEKLCDGYDRAQFYEDQGKYLLMKRAVRRTLGALGIKISGINDEEGDENADDR